VEERQQPAAPTPRRDRLSTLALFLGSFLAVVLIGLLAALVTWALHPHRRPPCLIHCPPPEANTSALAVTALAEQKSFTSSALGFQVDYPDKWKLDSSDAAKAVFQTRDGLLEVAGVTASPAQALAERAAGLPRSRLPDLSQAGPIHGAHVGIEEGVGVLYAGTLVPESGGGQGIEVRIALIAARRGTLTMLFTALVPYDTRGGGLPAGDIDYALTEFRWPGER
jgi:hypothetical protein